MITIWYKNCLKKAITIFRFLNAASKSLDTISEVKKTHYYSILTEIGNAKADRDFVGIINEVLIYNRAVSANEAKQLFEARGLPVQPAGKLALRWGQLKAAP